MENKLYCVRGLDLYAMDSRTHCTQLDDPQVGTPPTLLVTLHRTPHLSLNILHFSLIPRT